MVVLPSLEDEPTIEGMEISKSDSKGEAGEISSVFSVTEKIDSHGDLNRAMVSASALVRNLNKLGNTEK